MAWISGRRRAWASSRSAGDPPTEPRRLASSSLTTHHRLDVVRRPTAVFQPGRGERRHVARAAGPAGQPARDARAVYESTPVPIGFATATSKRWQAKRRQRGFGASQLDVAIRLPLRKFAVSSSTCRPNRPVQSCEIVLFLTEGATNTAELPTSLIRRPGRRRR